jgi:hypothetical protein
LLMGRGEGLLPQPAPVRIAPRRLCPRGTAEAVLLVVFERPLLCRYSRLDATEFGRFCYFWVAVFCPHLRQEWLVETAEVVGLLA